MENLRIFKAFIFVSWSAFLALLWKNVKKKKMIEFIEGMIRVGEKPNEYDNR